ncbi:MAG: MBL fold metallo-hydrolase [Elusimicrobiota bacterium]|jgi:metallo-beta-lactamase family protein|nr:MBL fold metallo-hydrolase [Elusimicrobiota bacterium]
MKKFIVFLLLLFCPLAFAEISITPFGAAGIVSGSSFLIESGPKSALIDCGLFYENDGDNFSINPKAVKAGALILTHSHLDHIGKVPLLIYQGFKGTIYSTPATKEFVLEFFSNGSGFDLIKRKWAWSKNVKAGDKKAIVHWIDSCIENIKKVQWSQKEAVISEVRREYGINFSFCKICLNLDTQKIANMFKTSKYNEKVKLFDNFDFYFFDAAHIPGSASLFFNIDGKKIVFSGDLGSGYSRLTGQSQNAPKADFVFMEGTNSANIEDDAAYDSFHSDLKRALAQDKSVWITALAFNRTQKVLYELKLMQDDGEISKNIEIYSISPYANKINRLYDEEVKNKANDWFVEDIYKNRTVLPKNLKFTAPKDFSKQFILLSASGNEKTAANLIKRFQKRGSVLIMSTNYLSEDNILLKIPYSNSQADKIETKKYGVFSDHPNVFELLRWLSNQDKNAQIYLVHYDVKNIRRFLRFFADKNINLKETKILEKVVIKQ